MTNEFMKQLGDALGIPEAEQKILDAGSNHIFGCRCETCRQWWKLMGPADADDDGNGSDYGPFSKEEIENS